ncbi:V-ATPase assembly factor Pkr1 [Schizosaccharomyces cryophilus OY26]|uniref:V-ATPase assembly factor Pkr1 n=1 Tax=Schizosaccharomyces cryophilus (strain OY26 / ATCC MYA-4695 / CBS 11777 / NBRC 106824 / NRRL Y48691) TaxID=653667 RepID=S9XKA1_SCHCR|nr:V-ATPase assembly factor Pkr1 [Schizosaccharomyces cryophilus OY26]EPY54126.1 V-ATPase assembly factor Pkr1 [Schizosaccharomyces cryophilus OY26]
MASYFQELWQSIFTPGVTPVLAKSAHIACAALAVLFLALYISTKSIHCIILLVLTLCLWLSLIWFLVELAHSRMQGYLTSENQNQNQNERRTSSSTDQSQDLSLDEEPLRARTASKG